jgi:hypothetical protein
LIGENSYGVSYSSVVDFDFLDIDAKDIVEGMPCYIPERAKQIAMKLTAVCCDNCELMGLKP